MIPPFVNKLNFNGMVEYGNKILLGTASDINNTNIHTKSYLRHLTKVTKSLPYNALPTSLENYIREVKIIREFTSSSLPPTTAAMVKI